jgi:hypothetical protein
LLAQGTTRHEVVYGVTSLTPEAASPTPLLELVRQHWGIENGLHYRREVTFHEDAGRTKNWNLAHALAAIHNLCSACWGAQATRTWLRPAATMPLIPMTPCASSWLAQTDFGTALNHQHAPLDRWRILSIIVLTSSNRENNYRRTNA